MQDGNQIFKEIGKIFFKGIFQQPGYDLNITDASLDELFDGLANKADIRESMKRFTAKVYPDDKYDKEMINDVIDGKLELPPIIPDEDLTNIISQSTGEIVTCFENKDLECLPKALSNMFTKMTENESMQEQIVNQRLKLFIDRVTDVKTREFLTDLYQRGKYQKEDYEKLPGYFDEHPFEDGQEVNMADIASMIDYTISDLTGEDMNDKPIDDECNKN